MPVPGGETPQHVGRRHFADAKEAVGARREPDRIADRERGEPRRQRSAGHDDEVELVRLFVRRVHERIGPADHRLLMLRAARAARGVANCPATNLTSGAATCSETRLLRPMPIAGHPPFDPCCHVRPAFARQVKSHYAYAPKPRDDHRAHGSICGRRGCAMPRRSSPPPRASRALHGPWTRPPETRARFAAFVARFAPRATMHDARGLSGVSPRGRRAGRRVQFLRDRARRLPQRLSRLLRASRRMPAAAT